MASSPVLSRRSLGAELRRLREQAKVKVSQAARELDCSPSKISRIETGVTAPRRPEIESLVRLYGGEAQARREHLIELAEGGKESAWYDEYGDLLEPGSTLHRYIGLEEGASQIRMYSSQWLPGLLQNEAFARAVFSVTQPSRSDDAVERLIQYRLDRKKVLSRAPEPLRLAALLDEAVLRRPAAGPGVMRRQIEELSETVSKRPSNVEIRVLPFSMGLHGLLGGDFTLMGFDHGETDIIFFEGQEGGVFQEKPEIVQQHDDRWDGAWKAGVEGDELVDLLKEIASTFQ